MKQIKTYEKFVEDDFDKFKKEDEKKFIKRFGDKNIKKFVKEGDIDGINFLVNNNYNFNNDYFEDNFLTDALNNDQLEIIDILLKTDYLKHEYNNTIDSISLEHIVGKKTYNSNQRNVVDKNMINRLKIITKYGYDFFHKGNHNLIELYLTEYNDGKVEFMKGSIPFIDWILKNYPIHYTLVKEFLPERLKKKYKYLENSNKYNL